MPSAGQIILLVVIIALYCIGGALSLLRLKWDRESLRITSKACLYFGIMSSIGLLVWHMEEAHEWLPRDNFDSLIWLSILITLFVMYVQRSRPIPGLDYMLMPVVVLLLVMAGVFGRENYHEYVAGTWQWVHWVSSFGGAVAFAAAAAGGVMYLIQNRRLRAKRMEGLTFGSLERLEHLTRVSVTLGFALLTIGLITGVVYMVNPGRPIAVSKIVFGTAAWFVYAIVLHAPISPVLRGRKTAILSVVGFVLMISAILAVSAGGGR